MTKGCAHAASGSLASGPAHGSGLPEWCFFLFFDLRLCFSPVGACVLDASGAAAAGGTVGGAGSDETYYHPQSRWMRSESANAR